LIDPQLNDITGLFHDSPIQGSVQSSVQLSVTEVTERFEESKLGETENEAMLLLNKSRLVFSFFFL